MKIHGKERNFCMTIGAAKRIAKLCPEGKLENLNVMLSNGNTVDMVEKVTELLVILNEGYENKRAFEEPGYTPDVLTVEELETLEVEELTKLQTEALRTIRKDQKPDVEVGQEKPGRKSKNVKSDQV